MASRTSPIPMPETEHEETTERVPNIQLQRRWSVFSKDHLLPALRRSIRGAVLTSTMKGYDDSLMLYNGAIDDLKPAVVIRPFDSNDVASVVRVASEYGLTLSVKSGGHSSAGHCLRGQIVLDLGRSLNSVWVLDPDDKHPDPWVRIDGGAKVGDVDEAVCRRGYVAPLGTYQGIGVGSILGGGLGYVSRLWGLSVDNLVEAEVVLADGSIVICNEDEYPDLFWAIRGAGANFGVVTSVVMRLHALRKCYSGMVIFPMKTSDDAVEILTRWTKAFPKSTPGELSTGAKIGTNANGEHVVVFSFCYSGAEEEGRKLIDPFLESIPFTAMMNSIRTRDYVQQQRNTSQYVPPAGYRYGVRGRHIQELTPEVIRLVADSVIALPESCQRSVVDITLLGGAISNVGPNVTALANRDAAYEVLLIATWEEEAEDKANEDWMVGTIGKLSPFAVGGASPNANETGDEVMVKNTYGVNYEKLQQLKKKYDPQNLFKNNLNILPAK